DFVDGAASSLSTSTVYFFLNKSATPESYTLSLHDALPISGSGSCPRIGKRRESVVATRARCKVSGHHGCRLGGGGSGGVRRGARDRKSTRLNSSHVAISYAVFCLKKKTRLRGFL